MVNKILLSLVIALFINCSPAIFKSKWTKELAPETFVTRFETSRGNFDIEIIRKSSPKAADRFYQLVKHGFFDDGIFYRVNPNFVAQFGSSDGPTYQHWNKVKVADEIVIKGNQRGSLSFARGGKKSRTTDLFINLSDNSRLDTLLYNEVKGFPSFGKVVHGMNVVDSLYSGYADTTMETLDLMYANRDGFLKNFPKLDVIHKAYLLN